MFLYRTERLPGAERTFTMQRTTFFLMLRVGAALSSQTSAATAAPKDRSAECIQKLQVIYKSLKSYQRDRQRLPDQLSDLIPQYLPDKDALHCPDDDDSG